MTEIRCEECRLSAAPLRLDCRRTNPTVSILCTAFGSFMLVAGCEPGDRPTLGRVEQLPSEGSSCRAEAGQGLVGTLASSVKLADLPRNHRFVFAAGKVPARNDASRLTLAVDPRSGRIVEAYCG